VAGQARRLQIGDRQVVLTGGLCQCDYICDALSKELNTRVITHKNGRYAGAIGAALSGM
jgi:activator of 2-hydroxyglutaryl-CoA dehydratase